MKHLVKNMVLYDLTPLTRSTDWVDVNVSCSNTTTKVHKLGFNLFLRI